MLGVLSLLVPAVAAATVPSAPPEIDLDPRKHLSADDYASKREGWYLTGLPLAAFDPNFGIGAGLRIYSYWNGGREAPLFGFTPYRQRLFAQAFASTGALQFHWLDYDAPYLLDGPYRLRAQLLWVREPAHNYFGTGSRSLDALRSPTDGRRYRSIDAYDDSLAVIGEEGLTHANYDRVDLLRPSLFVSLERTFLAGTVRPQVGLGFTRAVVRDYSGRMVDGRDELGQTVAATQAPTRLRRDCDAGRLTGCGGGWDNTLRFGVSYDTRDLEPDPNGGVYLDAAVDVGSGLVGSAFDYARLLLAGRVYYSPVPAVADLVLALRGTYQVQTRGTPFFSMDLLAYTEDTRAGLGGLRTLRGFRQDRFIGPVMAVVNGEVRWTFAGLRTFAQDFSFVAVVFGDAGRAFDTVRETSYRRWQSSAGGALRIAWNQATVISIDYGASVEGSGLYVNFNHMF